MSYAIHSFYLNKGYEVVSGGSGSAAAPKMIVPGFPEAKAQMKLSFGKDLQKNGAVAEIVSTQ